MATAMARSVLRTAVRGGPLARTPASKRSFGSSAHDDAHETAKWEKITYAGIVTCSVLAFYILSKGHAHYEEPLPYPHLHIRNKEFPWVFYDMCRSRWPF
ncbi:cytochrome c oxidase subunit 6a, mitochondrial-like isoform X3 [Camellia sinensis]|uniref:cytochrome c oxidase subunit 6a, mitochondrial-like isoform X3 n=1 Tax=Camellia sinensis TaxID=4442 RepID=UPI001036BFAC|nr:cytochrome c oxidase subunit 6a, mitochondrial-like isoform X3 [Camellia sinensis]